MLATMLQKYAFNLTFEPKHLNMAPNTTLQRPLVKMNGTIEFLDHKRIYLGS